MIMVQFDRIKLGKQAKEFGFVRDTFEKVCRLVDVLAFFESDKLLAENLALKGGTAINLTVFDLPRLSVDIDLDYSSNVKREKMLEQREQITEHIQKYMIANGYILSPKSKSYHALDSFVFDYMNAGGTKDNLKIEINYMLRCHILPVSRRNISFIGYQNDISVLCVDMLEIISAKTMALINRAAPRDLYDMSNVIRKNIIDASNLDLYRKSVAFYGAIASENVPTEYLFKNIYSITEHKVKSELNPVLRRTEHFDLASEQKFVKNYLEEMLVLSEAENDFWRLFSKGEYRPEILFKEADIIDRIKEHPMAIWKCSRK